MVKELVHDPMFLGIKSKTAAKDDAAVARDLPVIYTVHVLFESHALSQ